jgi:N-acetylglucosamine-6-phosphate deacetylase
VLAEEWLVDRVVLPDRVLAGVRIAAVDGRIVAIDRLAAGPGAIRLRGSLLPGMLDLQVNGAGGRSVQEATAAALDTIALAVWQGGATAFLPTLITAPFATLLEQTAAVAAWIRNWNGSGAQPLGLHLEGPFLTTAGAHDPAHFVDPTPARLDALLAAAGDQLRLVTLAPARPQAAAATAWLRQRGVAVALGHCDSTTGFADCVAAGANAVTHLFNVMGRMHHREPGLAALALDTAQLHCPVIADGVHVHPTMVRLAFRILGPDRLLLVTDAMAAAGMPEGQYELGGTTVTAREGIVRDAAGNLAGSALTMAAAARNFLQWLPEAGPWTLARVAAHNPAVVCGRADTYGTIAVGRSARFTLLGDDGSVHCIASTPRQQS